MTDMNRRVVLAARPVGLPRKTDFRLEQVALPVAGAGQIQVRNVYVSVDPGIRARLGESGSYAKPLGLGEVVEGATVGEVVSSDNPKFTAGDWVAAAFGWQQFAVSDGRGVRKLDVSRVPPSTAIGVLGIPGLSAAVPQATYLFWIDCRGTGVADPQAACEAAGLGPSDGRDFGFPGFIRLNTACPTARLEEALRRLRQAFSRR